MDARVEPGRIEADLPMDWVEVWSSAGVGRVSLAGDRITIGRSSRNDVIIDDPQISRLHAVMERLGGAWCIRDISSRNGTFVNGGRIVQQATLRPGDEIRVGRTRLMLRGEGPVSDTDVEVTVAHRPPPRLTHRERDTLLALFSAVSATDTFTELATPRDIAGLLWITEAAVRHHLASLYEKFEIDGGGEQRRVRLANEALRRGAITFADVRASTAERAATGS
ncbi:FHA domain-containing protein [Pseudonocardia sp. TRM90224]|uniref:FHA domain-containing protein n=1 Tax=Pseudonocardia sp. TRM90224 TaxID=2812678 RepID=UPI001E526909|nr:FHA domain-containing protein [Pseudonocardia sp. TRM90224]